MHRRCDWPRAFLRLFYSPLTRKPDGKADPMEKTPNRAHSMALWRLLQNRLRAILESMEKLLYLAHFYARENVLR